MNLCYSLREESWQRFPHRLKTCKRYNFLRVFFFHLFLHLSSLQELDLYIQFSMSQTRLCRLSIFLIIFLKLHLAFQRLNHLPRLKDVRSLSLTSVFLLSRSWTWSRVCHFLRVTYSVASQPQPRLPGSVLKLTSKVIACLFSLKIQEAIYLYYILQFFLKNC